MSSALTAPIRRHTPYGAILLVLAACTGADPANAPPTAAEIAPGSVCVLDGMALGEFPGPKAQIHWRGRAEPDMFCDTLEMFAVMLEPEQATPITAAFVQDMGKANWDEPRGHWIPARTAYYVAGSSQRGSMGQTLVPFSERAAADGFAARYGGEVLTFDEIDRERVRLDGGALHDQRM